MSGHESNDHVVIVGAGLAGARVAQMLRARGSEARITIVGDETHAAYERPALSKSYLASDAAGKRIPLLRGADSWASDGIHHRAGRIVSHVNMDTNTVLLDDGDELSWTSLVIATGVSPRVIPALQDLPHVMTLRTHADADRIRERIDVGAPLLVIGGGFIGTEVASTAVSLGSEVTVVEAAPAPFMRALGAEVGTLLGARMIDYGVDLRCATSVADMRATSSVTGGGIVATLDDGTERTFGAVVVGIGSTPRVPAFIGGATPIALAADGSVLTDHAGRTSIDGVYACGDVATWFRPSMQAHMRVEHWTCASGQGAAVAGAILGDDAGYDHMPFFWSDQCGMRLQHVGYPLPWTSVEIDEAGGGIVAEYRDDRGTVIGTFAVDRPDVIAAARRAAQRTATAA